MTTDTSKKIIEFVKSKRQTTAKELADFFPISNRAIFKQLKKLINESKLVKIGRPPKVFYMLAEKKVDKKDLVIDSNTQSIIEENYLIITPIGKRLDGFEGFVYWCNKNNEDAQKTAKEYVKTFKKYHSYLHDGLINGIDKMKNTFKIVHLDHLFYLDFYSIERFGKTKLGQLLLYAKQSQNKEFIKSLIAQIKPKIDLLIKKYKIGAVGFISPTVKRPVQFMKELQRHLNLEVPIIPITKIKTDIIVPQKTLNKLADRIDNAQMTLVAEGNKTYKNVLLIDDAVGSGATLNEMAGQIKSKKFGRNVIGLSITGSFKGFDIISEV